MAQLPPPFRPGQHPAALGGGADGLRLGLGGGERALGHAGGAVPAGIDAFTAAILAIALPGDDKVAGAVHRDLGHVLASVRVRVDAELAALGHSGGAVALGVDAVAAAVLARARPRDDEVAVELRASAGLAGNVGGAT